MTPTIPTEVTLDDVHLELPAGAAADVGAEPGPPSGDDVLAERRWMTDDGMYVVLSITPALRGPELDPLALDLSAGATLERYVRSFDGEVEGPVEHRVDGAIAARAAQALVTDVVGQRLELKLASCLTADRRIVTVQVATPAGAGLSDLATAVCRSLRVG